MVEADNAKDSPEVVTGSSSSRAEIQSGKVVETTQQVSCKPSAFMHCLLMQTPNPVAGSAEIVLISPEGNLSQLKPAGESTPKQEAKAADTAERKDTASSKMLSTTAKQVTISSKQETITTNKNTTSDIVLTENGTASTQSIDGASQKVTKSGPVQVVNTFVLDDDEDLVDVKTPPKHSVIKNAKPQIKDKSQSIEEIMDDLGNALAMLYFICIQ